MNGGQNLFMVLTLMDLGSLSMASLKVPQASPNLFLLQLLSIELCGIGLNRLLQLRQRLCTIRDLFQYGC
ncbi:hypothetical protein H5410_040167 [Solanum commersonii]|uniref:Uncharacterized protein n=1 Tax=Solanum commersonii TaxID=4109 RepID=A0A9J5XPB2_SOLCO|nr:hypothetical protein H5410_040167 [Solanum commersonii]